MLNERLLLACQYDHGTNYVCRFDMIRILLRSSYYIAINNDFIRLGHWLRMIGLLNKPVKCLALDLFMKSNMLCIEEYASR